MKDKQLTTLIVSVVVIVIGVLLYRAYQHDDVSPVSSPDIDAELKDESRSTQVSARLTQCNRTGGGKTVAEGLVTNIGNVELHYVTVKVHWMNSAGQVVEANEIYALNNEALPAGETKAFTNVTAKITAVRCNVETVDWW